MIRSVGLRCRLQVGNFISFKLIVNSDISEDRIMDNILCLIS